jgi:hypothetical protein
MAYLAKLTRNYKGYGFFTHRVEFHGYGDSGRRHMQQQWIRLRNRLWSAHGPSAEQELARPENFGGIQPKWAWDSEKSSIYLRDEALTEFLLMKENYQ